MDDYVTKEFCAERHRGTDERLADIKADIQDIKRLLSNGMSTQVKLNTAAIVDIRDTMRAVKGGAWQVIVKLLYPILAAVLAVAGVKLSGGG